jgi:hypothetical protein
MFRYFANGLFLLNGSLWVLASGGMLSDYKAALGDLKVDAEEFGSITAASNAGAFCTATRLEHCFVLYVGLLLLSIGVCVPVESKGIPALGAAISSFVVCHSETMISTNTLPGIQIYQGEFTELLAFFANVNLGFGVLFAMVAIGSFLGMGAAEATNDNKKKNA